MKHRKSSRKKYSGDPARRGDDKRPFSAVLVRETGKAVLLRITLPGGDREIWQPRAAVSPLAGGQWLISESAMTVKVQEAEEVSKADAAFGKDMLPVRGEIIGQTPKAWHVEIMVSWGGAEPVPWREFVPKSQAAHKGGRLCLSRWIIGEKQAELERGVPHNPAVYIGKPVIEIDSEALAAAIRGPDASPSQRPPLGHAMPAIPPGQHPHGEGATSLEALLAADEWRRNPPEERKQPE